MKHFFIKLSLIIVFTIFSSFSPSSEEITLHLYGWQPINLPLITKTFNESGTIVLKISVNKEGYVSSIHEVQSNVSPKVVKYYKSASRQLMFERIIYTKAPDFSIGQVIYKVKHQQLPTWKKIKENEDNLSFFE
ncbi:MAG: hypothetical protein ACK4ND_00135 [Cytophagaceae bacterium]